MNDIDLVMNGFIHLTDNQQEEILRQINEYKKASYYDKRTLAESIEKRAARIVRTKNEESATPASASRALLQSCGASQQGGARALLISVPGVPARSMREGW